MQRYVDSQSISPYYSMSTVTENSTDIQPRISIPKLLLSLNLSPNLIIENWPHCRETPAHRNTFRYAKFLSFPTPRITFDSPSMHHPHMSRQRGWLVAAAGMRGIVSALASGIDSVFLPRSAISPTGEREAGTSSNHFGRILRADGPDLRLGPGIDTPTPRVTHVAQPHEVSSVPIASLLFRSEAT